MDKLKPSNRVPDPVKEFIKANLDKKLSKSPMAAAEKKYSAALTLIAGSIEECKKEEE